MPHTSTPTATPTSIVCLSLSSRDRLQLINGSRHLWRPLLDAVNAAGSGTNVTTKDLNQQNLEIKLNGWPWENASLSDGVEARKILLAVFRTQPIVSYQYCMISLNRNDRLRLIDCPIIVINAVRDSINARFKLQDEANLQISHEFKLKGYPWMANGSETVAARFLVSTILEKVSSIGWPVLTSLDISRRANDKGVFVLRSASGLSLPSSIPSPSYFCVSLNETDKIRLINAPSHIVAMLKNVVGTYWSAGIRREQEYFGSYEMKLNGAPWNGMETQDSLAAK
uniref:Uncharacterized protein n=1 Tax=Romanomermis culicivorax TaxID=13658 RepID=A0A915KRN7_ROMCU